MRWRLKIHPTGRVSWGFLPRSRSNGKGQRRRQSLASSNSFQSVRCTALLEHSGGSGGSSITDCEEGSDRMGLSPVLNSQKVLGEQPRQRKKRGQKGISSAAANQVRDGVWYLERQFGRKRLTFATWTLPRSALPIVAFWSEFVRLLLAKLRYRLEKVGLPPLVVGVTEIQSKRWEREGGEYPPLHLHWVFVGRHLNGAWWLSPSEADDLLFSTLQNFLSNLNREDFVSAGRLESIRKSATGYLGKYLSKGRGSVAAVENRTWLPASWSVCTRDLRRVVARLVRAFEVCSERFSPEELVACLVWYRPVFYWAGGYERVCGGVGGLSTKDLPKILELLEASYEKAPPPVKVKPSLFIRRWRVVPEGWQR